MSFQHGQSLIEFAIAVFVLVSMALGMQLLASYHDIQRQAMMAARTSVFSTAWSSSLPAASNQVQYLRELHFQHAGWRDPTGQVALLSGPAAVDLRVSQDAPPARTAQLLDGVLRPLQTVGGWLGSGFDLSTQTFARAQVTVQLPALTHLPQPWSELSLQLVEPAALMADGWSAAGPGQVAQRASALVPSHVFAQPVRVITPVLWIASLFEPSLRQLCLGLIEPERVPEDRLSVNTRHTTQPGPAGCR